MVTDFFTNNLSYLRHFSVQAAAYVGCINEKKNSTFSIYFRCLKVLTLESKTDMCDTILVL